MIIDWSKAPEGAEFARTWGNEGGPNGVDFYRPDGADGLLYSVGSGWAVAVTEPNDPHLVRRQALWNGEGLPPVGTVCEYLRFGTWAKVEVFAIKPNANGGSSVLHTYEDGTWHACANPDAFRPLRTPEQIAAEKQEQEVSELAHDFYIVGFRSYRLTAEDLHKLGYRKVEGGEA